MDSVGKVSIQMPQSPYARALLLVGLALLVPMVSVGGQTVSETTTSILLPASDGSVLSVSTQGVAKLTPVDLRQGKLVARYNILKLLDERYFNGARIERFFEMAQLRRSRARLGENHLAVVKGHVRVPAQQNAETIAVRFTHEVLVGDGGVLRQPVRRGPAVERVRQRAVDLG